MSCTYHQNRLTIAMRAVMLVAGTMLFLGCGSGTQTEICTQGELQTCACVGGSEGVQECLADRQGWAMCQCDSEEDQPNSNGGAEEMASDDEASPGMAGRSATSDNKTGAGAVGGEASAGGEAGAGAVSGAPTGGGEAGAGAVSGTPTSGGDDDAGGPVGIGAMRGGDDDAGGPVGIGAMGGGSDGSGAEGGRAASDDADSRRVTLWAHTFNDMLGPGTGLQPGDMETQGEQGFTDGGSWISTGGWLSKTISTEGYTTIEVGYLLTKDAGSTCELNVSIDGGTTWVNVIRDNGPGWYRLNGTLPPSAEGEEHVVLRWTSEVAWCWINNITITASGNSGVDAGASNDEMRADDDAASQVPTPVFHIFLLMGQSNMVGCDIITPQERRTDERVSVLGYETCPDSNRVVNQWDAASPPLHTCTAGIGPGDYFAKTLVEALPDGHTIGLVPTAESGQWIETFLQGGPHHQKILDKIQIAGAAENARFSGIIFHQGESDSGDPTWPSKVQQLYTQVKEAMGIEYDIPFIAGEMLHGGACAAHNVLVHQVSNLGSHFDYVSAEGLAMAPGDEWLVHFDHASQVMLGRRYGEKMRAALGW
ncbi:MAG: sialate O-acetylesterase [Myxococcota bacterium]|nr:sialate O-acetylesterase [Myxococcota bacterium]